MIKLFNFIKINNSCKNKNFKINYFTVSNPLYSYCPLQKESNKNDSDN